MVPILCNTLVSVSMESPSSNGFLEKMEQFLSLPLTRTINSLAFSLKTNGEIPRVPKAKLDPPLGALENVKIRLTLSTLFPEVDSMASPSFGFRSILFHNRVLMMGWEIKAIVSQVQVIKLSGSLQRIAMTNRSCTVPDYIIFSHLGKVTFLVKVVENEIPIENQWNRNYSNVSE